MGPRKIWRRRLVRMEQNEQKQEFEEAVLIAEWIPEISGCDKQWLLNLGVIW